MIDFIKKMLESYKIVKRNNTLEIENEVLKESIKSELFKEFMKKLGEPDENERLRDENRRLRAQNKELKHKNGGAK